MRLGKKGQITVFIIIGIILLFSVGLYLYLKNQGIGPGKILQPKRAPIEQYIDTCLEQKGKEALVLAGKQAGYTTIPIEIDFNPTRYVSVVPGTKLKTPFWYFDGNSRYPNEDRLEQELINYIESDIRTCFQNFYPFQEEFEIEEKSDPKVRSVLFTKDSAVFEMAYELQLTSRAGGETITTKNFIAELPVKFRQMYELAQEILQAENEQYLFEQMTIDLMSIHPPDDIPFTGMLFDCGQKTWFIRDIREKIQKMIRLATAQIRFDNTDYIPFADPDIDNYEVLRNRTYQDMMDGKLPPKPQDAYSYFHFFWDVTDNNYKDLTVGVEYRPDWGMNIGVKPSRYGVMKSQRGSLRDTLLSFMCLQTFHFVYDLQYPVKIMIRDPDAFNGEGYTFEYAFPVQIYHNAPDRSALPVIYFEENALRPQFCDKISDDELTVIVKDALFHHEINKANVSFRCIDEFCKLGQTRTNNQRIQWKGFLPQGCGGGFVMAEKEGYIPAEKQLGVGQDSIALEMIPLRKFDITVVKHPQNALHLEKPLAENEEALIMVKAMNYDYDYYGRYFPSRFDYSGGGLPTQVFENGSLELIKGDVTYGLEIFLTQKAGDTSQLVGGWLGNWTVSASEVLDSNRIKLHVVEQVPKSTDPEVTAEFFMLLNNASAYQGYAKPEFIFTDIYAEGEAGFE